ncbi:TetR/AcrR family transcriptional regulator [Bacillus testis]|uniref:TetR/AcrR family transcriptional regulator n=1 Tax=Bacillus testis TaxID=1622072 RepID=UPI00067ED6DC|nr:TetR/AcrR family transcriptional regulator [Bacillus testis]
MNNHIDRRITKSKQALKGALLSLMKEKDFKAIAITDIVQVANLNRGTFYKHYQYKDDLLEEIMDDVIADLIESYREPYKGNENFDVKNLTSSAIKIFEHVDHYKEFYTLLQSSTLSGFQDKICLVLKEIALQDLFDMLPDAVINRELLASYHAFAIFGMIKEWINHQFKYSADYMAEQLLAIVKHSQGMDNQSVKRL